MIIKLKITGQGPKAPVEPVKKKIKSSANKRVFV
jgi:hypothetical protein